MEAFMEASATRIGPAEIDSRLDKRRICREDPHRAKSRQAVRAICKQEVTGSIPVGSIDSLGPTIWSESPYLTGYWHGRRSLGGVLLLHSPSSSLRARRGDAR
jgi:hypothetical protein